MFILTSLIPKITQLFHLYSFLIFNTKKIFLHFYIIFYQINSMEQFLSNIFIPLKLLIFILFSTLLFKIHLFNNQSNLIFLLLIHFPIKKTTNINFVFKIFLYFYQLLNLINFFSHIFQIFSHLFIIINFQIFYQLLIFILIILIIFQKIHFQQFYQIFYNILHFINSKNFIL
jgi:hypothetical protein